MSQIKAIEVCDESEALEPSFSTSWLKYYPIALIFLFIAGVSILSQFRDGKFNWLSLMNEFMAGFFIVFSFFKFLNIKGFSEAYQAYDVIAKRFALYGYIYPFIELALGIFLLLRVYPVATNLICLAVMSVSSFGVLKSLLNKSQFQCACLGTVVNFPMSRVTLIEDSLMVVMSAVMLWTMR